MTASKRPEPHDQAIEAVRDYTALMRLHGRISHFEEHNLIESQGEKHAGNLRKCLETLADTLTPADLEEVIRYIERIPRVFEWLDEWSPGVSLVVSRLAVSCLEQGFNFGRLPVLNGSSGASKSTDDAFKKGRAKGAKARKAAAELTYNTCVMEFEAAKTRGEEINYNTIAKKYGWHRSTVSRHGGRYFGRPQ
jgi:hypothetical protein